MQPDLLEELFFSGLIGSVQIDSVIPYILNMQVFKNLNTLNMQQVGFEIFFIPCVAVGRVRRDGGGRGDDRVGVRGDQGGNSITTNVEAKKDNQGQCKGMINDQEHLFAQPMLTWSDH